MTSLQDRPLIRKVTLVLNRKNHLVDVTQTLRIASGSLSKDVSNSVTSKRQNTDLLPKRMLLLTVLPVLRAVYLTVLLLPVVVMVSAAQQTMVSPLQQQPRRIVLEVNLAAAQVLVVVGGQP